MNDYNTKAMMLKKAEEERIRKEQEEKQRKLEEAQQDMMNGNTEEAQAKIDEVIQKARNNASKGTVIVDSDFMGNHAKAYGVIDEAKELSAL